MSDSVTGWLRALTLDELAALYCEAVYCDDLTADACITDAERRDRETAAQAATRRRNAEWYDAAYAQYLAAEQATNGYLLSRAGEAHVTDPFSLWTGPEARAMKYASEELREFWYTNPRLTVTAWREQAAGARRAWIDERDLAAMQPPEPVLPVIPAMSRSAVARMEAAFAAIAASLTGTTSGRHARLVSA